MLIKYDFQLITKSYGIIAGDSGGKGSGASRGISGLSYFLLFVSYSAISPLLIVNSIILLRKQEYKFKIFTIKKGNFYGNQNLPNIENLFVLQKIDE